MLDCVKIAFDDLGPGVRRNWQHLVFIVDAVAFADNTEFVVRIDFNRLDPFSCCAECGNDVLLCQALLEACGDKIVVVNCFQIF